MRKHVWIYIAGPMTRPDILANTANGIAVYNRLMNFNKLPRASGLPLVVPICPHLSSLAHMFCPRGHAEWLEHDIALLLKCDAVYRIAGESAGADVEARFCKDNHPIPWLHRWGDLYRWIENQA